MIRGRCAAVEHLASGGLPDLGDAEVMAGVYAVAVDIASRWCHYDRDFALVAQVTG